MFWLTFSFTGILSGCEDANSAAGKGVLVLYVGVLFVHWCGLFWVPAKSLSGTKLKIQHLLSVSQMSTLPQKSATKLRSSYGCLFRKHQVQTRAYLPSEKINVCLCCPSTRPPVALTYLTLLYWLPRRRVAMPPQWFPCRQHTRKTAPAYLQGSQKGAWTFVSSTRSLSCQLQTVWGAPPKALFWISLWWGDSLSITDEALNFSHFPVFMKTKWAVSSKEKNFMCVYCEGQFSLF